MWNSNHGRSVLLIWEAGWWFSYHLAHLRSGCEWALEQAWFGYSVRERSRGGSAGLNGRQLARELVRSSSHTCVRSSLRTKLECPKGTVCRFDLLSDDRAWAREMIKMATSDCWSCRIPANLLKAVRAWFGGFGRYRSWRCVWEMVRMMKWLEREGFERDWWYFWGFFFSFCVYACMLYIRDRVRIGDKVGWGNERKLEKEKGERGSRE